MQKPTVFDVADVLVEHVRRDFADDVALVAYYGSYARGTATPRSDLDLFFVPATMRGRDATLSVLVDGICFDFWPIEWEWLERSAVLAERGAPILAEARILYARSDAEAVRFETLRATLSRVVDEGDPVAYADRAGNLLQQVFPLLYAMRQPAAAALVEQRRYAVEVVTIMVGALALLNRTYLGGSATDQLDQVLDLPLRPTGLATELDVIMNSCDPEAARRACERAVDAVAELIMERRVALAVRPTLPEIADGFFEELSGLLDKLRTACERGDRPVALTTSIAIEAEIAGLLAEVGSGIRPGVLGDAVARDAFRKAGLPELLPLVDDPTALRSAVDDLERALREHLHQAGVIIREVESAGALRRLLGLDQDNVGEPPLP